MCNTYEHYNASEFPIDLLMQVTKNIILMLSYVMQERLQFYIEPVETKLPSIIDSLLVNLKLQLGEDFTEEMMFTGFHNISTMTMSFRVQCSPGFCGRDCITTPINDPRVAECHPNGSAMCVDNIRDPLTLPPCSNCLYNLDIATNCSTCLEANYDPDTNCQTCLPNYNITTNCSLCNNKRYDPATSCSICINTQYNSTTNCESCLNSIFDPLDRCTSCVLEFYDPSTNCTKCLPNRDPSTNCTQCLPGWDNTSNCTQCVSGFTGNNCEPSECLHLAICTIANCPYKIELHDLGQIRQHND